jgi:hypothetical protein
MAVNNTSTSKAVTSGTHFTQEGTVKSVVGIVKAVNEGGVARILQVGDKVYVGDTVLATGDYALVVETQGITALETPRSDHIALDSDIYSPKPATENQPEDEVSRIQKAIAEGRDPTLVTDAAAAGGAVDEGSSVPLVIDFNNTQGNVNSGPYFFSISTAT